MQPTIKVEGLKELRGALRGVEAQLPREITKALKEGARIAAVRAHDTARNSSGRLANRMRPGASGARAYLANSLIYAGVQEFGGTIRFANRQTTIHIEGSHAMENAIHSSSEQILTLISYEIDQVVVRNGFR